MYSTYLFLLTVVTLSSPAVAQGILSSVDSQDGSGESESSLTHSVSSKGMIILCTIVAVVVLIGGMFWRGDTSKYMNKLNNPALTTPPSLVVFTAVFITAKKRRLKTREAVSFTDSTDGPLSVTHTTGRGQPISESTKGGAIQPDLEKNARVRQDRSHRDSDTKQRGWGSYFSFGRT
ncbi:hypothetical protein BO94DRAFT_115500 [Aspergillus sclerotioniger CBS 115572]|uniref:Transmembrane protein n=1 Tax=Aspergillus sclerotioniger CBS 115572 TaxID=1450535 RepID=A0A317WBT2_9EURO|nr:hypothetical protein BO94DRAFT_115500 [Aspergillus sclerotioniger CBS 115572]PWY83813.1 hypothetical protein BO94DRAFT_115500 [Aspergillus sclerotioniger CBS 115572]